MKLYITERKYINDLDGKNCCICSKRFFDKEYSLYNENAICNNCENVIDQLYTKIEKEIEQKNYSESIEFLKNFKYEKDLNIEEKYEKRCKLCFEESLELTKDNICSKCLTISSQEIKLFCRYCVKELKLLGYKEGKEFLNCEKCKKYFVKYWNDSDSYILLDSNFEEYCKLIKKSKEDYKEYNIELYFNIVIGSIVICFGLGLISKLFFIIPFILLFCFLIISKIKD